MKDEKDDKVACTMNGDRVRLGPDLGNGMHPFVRHKADHTMVTGICSRVKEGENITRALNGGRLPPPDPGDFSWEGVTLAEVYEVVRRQQKTRTGVPEARV